jgi:hypothetical protein
MFGCALDAEGGHASARQDALQGLHVLGVVAGAEVTDRRLLGIASGYSHREEGSSCRAASARVSL